MTTLTITRALKELKTLGDRIDKLTSESTFVFLVEKPGQLPVGYKSLEELEQAIKSSYQSIVDLIDYREKIKQAVVNSNATTKVTIGGKEYTVAAAIETKHSIKYKLQLGRVMHQQLQLVEARKVEARKELSDTQGLLDTQVPNSLDELLNNTHQGKTDIAEADYNSVARLYLERNQATVVDPLKLVALTSKLHNEVEAFMNNVDEIISVSNATTTIKV